MNIVGDIFLMNAGRGGCSRGALLHESAGRSALGSHACVALSSVLRFYDIDMKSEVKGNLMGNVTSIIMRHDI